MKLSEALVEALLAENTYRGTFYTGPVGVEEIGQAIKGLGLKVVIGTEHLYVEPLFGSDDWDAKERFFKLLKNKLGKDFGLSNWGTGKHHSMKQIGG